MLSELN